MINSESISIKAKNKIGRCKLCGFEKKLIKAHIFPKKLYKPIREADYDKSPSNPTPKIYSIETPHKPKKSPDGIYDDSILCEECDKNIGIWDDYGQTLFLSNPSQDNYYSEEGYKFYKINEFDYTKLKLFFISVLWRSAITDNAFFDQVKLGSWEDSLKKMILAQDPGSKNDFSVIIYRYEGKLSEIMLKPTKQRGEPEQVDYGVNYYNLRIPNYGFFIKVDQRNFSSRLNTFILSPNQPLLMHVMDYRSSAEYKSLLTDWRQTRLSNQSKPL